MQSSNKGNANTQQPCAIGRYHITTFSKPLHPLAAAFFPFTRHFQKKFGTESARAVLAAVTSPSAPGQQAGRPSRERGGVV
ncbi:hypothetical protein TSOC_013012 [Tetrabaena socialis]|uniref:Uncharacterized protein n=1 Tax=Tetrabaena socialis TaxID=47790 RepID=A0A2J7ZLH5_9CHLO|nr:hypothetical protein TSOC_013012 [Tetrabaena socialis]|eukprot:PNH01117.1 hypothetical protein TSOC_013012 [Tetrabaena socialis]